MSLRLDWCNHEAAKYAVEHWHYSRSMPAGKTSKVGVWEDGRFVGVVIFSRGAAQHIGTPYGLKQTEVCELTRVALTTHQTPTSRILAIAVKMLRQLSDGLRLIVSFADSSQGHHGGIYQANGWVFVGSMEYHTLKVNGRIVHPKTCHSLYGSKGQGIPWLRANVDPNAERIKNGIKHKYLMPLDDAMRRQIAPLAKPYPKRSCVGSVDSDTSADHAEKGGAMPTPTLQGAHV